MWYYDDYKKSSDLSTTLMWTYGGTSYSKTGMIGFIDALPQVIANHSWKDAGAGLTGSLQTATKKFGKSMYDMGEREGNAIVNQVKMAAGDAENFQATSSLYNSIITNSSSMLKEFDGTEIDVTIPTFTCYYIADKSGVNIRGLVQGDLDSYKLMGDSVIDPNDITSFPPGEFKFAKVFNNQTNVIGSYALQNSKFLMRNLLPTRVTVELGDVVIAGTADPAFAKVTIEFTYGRKPTQRTAFDYVMNCTAPSKDYTDLASLFTGQTSAPGS